MAASTAAGEEECVTVRWRLAVRMKGTRAIHNVPISRAAMLAPLAPQLVRPVPEGGDGSHVDLEIPEHVMVAMRDVWYRLHDANRRTKQHKWHTSHRAGIAIVGLPMIVSAFGDLLTLLLCDYDQSVHYGEVAALLAAADFLKPRDACIQWMKHLRGMDYNFRADGQRLLHALSFAYVFGFDPAPQMHKKYLPSAGFSAVEPPLQERIADAGRVLAKEVIEALTVTVDVCFLQKYASCREWGKNGKYDYCTFPGEKIVGTLMHLLENDRYRDTGEWMYFAHILPHLLRTPRSAALRFSVSSPVPAIYSSDSTNAEVDAQLFFGGRFAQFSWLLDIMRANNIFSPTMVIDGPYAAEVAFWHRTGWIASENARNKKNVLPITLLGTMAERNRARRNIMEMIQKHHPAASFFVANADVPSPGPYDPIVIAPHGGDVYYDPDVDRMCIDNDTASPTDEVYLAILSWHDVPDVVHMLAQHVETYSQWYYDGARLWGTAEAWVGARTSSANWLTGNVSSYDAKWNVETPRGRKTLAMGASPPMPAVCYGKVARSATVLRASANEMKNTDLFGVPISTPAREPPAKRVRFNNAWPLQPTTVQELTSGCCNVTNSYLMDRERAPVSDARVRDPCHKNELVTGVLVSFATVERIADAELGGKNLGVLLTLSFENVDDEDILDNIRGDVSSAVAGWDERHGVTNTQSDPSVAAAFNAALERGRVLVFCEKIGDTPGVISPFVGPGANQYGTGIIRGDHATPSGSTPPDIEEGTVVSLEAYIDVIRPSHWGHTCEDGMLVLRPTYVRAWGHICNAYLNAFVAALGRNRNGPVCDSADESESSE